MKIEYTHPSFGEEIAGRAGYYSPIEESVIPYRGREVLYVMGHACIDNSCCGMNGNWGYIQVPGYIVRRQVRLENGLPVSEIEIIEDPAARREIREQLLTRHPGSQVDMWTTDYAQC